MLGAVFNLEEIKTAINNVKKKKSVGFGKIHAKSFIRNNEWLGVPLKRIFNTTKLTVKLHSKWLQCIANFIFKKLGKYNINEYRPIAISNIVYKIRDTVITNRRGPYMNILTNELQTSYKVGRRAIDVLFP